MIPLLHKLRFLFSKKTNFLKVEDVRLEFAFEVGGIKYYEPTDLNLFPWQRMLAATSAYNKLSLAIKEEDLRYANNLIIRILSGDKINLVDLMHVKRVHDAINQRLDSKFRPEELMWDVAAVVFMDETESPYAYDPVYGQKKIEHWKKHANVTLFFSQLPLQRLIPFLPYTEQGSKMFSEITKELAKIEADISQVPASQNLLEVQKRALQNLQSRQSARATAPK